MSIRSYLNKDGTKLFEAYAIVRTTNGGKVQMKNRGFKSLREAERAEFELKRQLVNRSENHVPTHTWGEWFDACLKRMRLEFRPSTVINYDKILTKWTIPVWKDRPLVS